MTAAAAPLPAAMRAIAFTGRERAARLACLLLEL